MDSQMINDLAGVLEQESMVYKDILEISKNKTTMIVEGKVNELEKITKLELALIMKVGRLEAKREGIADQLAKQMNMDTSEFTLTELIKHVKNHEAEKLKEYQMKMSSVISEFKNTNDLNSKLIKNSLDYINFSINLIADYGSSGNNYGNNGDTYIEKKRTFFDKKL